MSGGAESGGGRWNTKQGPQGRLEMTAEPRLRGRKLAKASTLLSISLLLLLFFGYQAGSNHRAFVARCKQR